MNSITLAAAGVRMEGTTRINLVVGADIPDKLSELASSGRKRGEYVTKLIRAIHSGQLDPTSGTNLEWPKLNLVNLINKQDELERRVLKLEERLAEISVKHE